ncbi:MAG: hypothetical protein MSC31_14530 [Solirubrobacteraceae bacterium MAG38_C4-C5]|nr:hypothetical protein [Candidatus Siliceabacter maunaloa]
MTPQLAHSGHWLAQVAYVAPVTGYLIFLAVRGWRDRRRGRGPRSEREPVDDETQT